MALFCLCLWVLQVARVLCRWEPTLELPLGTNTGAALRLLRYAANTLLFTEKGVDPFLVSWNRDPGIGKISLCKALAQKLSIRFNSRFPQCQLIEVNAHSLLSKWFSENGKLVAKLFQKIQEMVVNALLTQIDKLKSSPNVIILTTSNITTTIGKSL
ncbi:pachytene checkpoint protein 2 homolog [Arachis stenosperma]|uniref:pachytene checkpoint protein 2 homolog n=1 Tax=Arachis stenosperma TaxID=217475 RepID=UPI0025ABE810|nr:pachytene checkpoint protein 2 homolog [Arachis stenosperma]